MRIRRRDGALDSSNARGAALSSIRWVADAMMGRPNSVRGSRSFDGEQRVSTFEEKLRVILQEDARTGRDPFLEALRAGVVSTQALRVWAQQIYLVVRDFARLLGAIYANCEDFAVRALVAQNLYEEHGRFIPGEDHPALMRRFGHRLGLTDEALEAAVSLPETADYLNLLFRLTREGSYLEGLAAVGLGVERSVPRYFRHLESLFRERYGFSAEDTEFFRVHITDDAEHAQRTMEIVVTHTRTPEQEDRVIAAIVATQAARRTYREAVYRTCVGSEASVRWP